MSAPLFPGRCAKVVSWLEALSAAKLSSTAGSRFYPNEGVWRETLLSSKGLGGAPELDPDAPTRDKVRLSRTDQRTEERLAGYLWQLLRAGEGGTELEVGGIRTFYICV